MVFGAIEWPPSFTTFYARVIHPTTAGITASAETTQQKTIIAVSKKQYLPSPRRTRSKSSVARVSHICFATPHPASSAPKSVLPPPPPHHLAPPRAAQSPASAGETKFTNLQYQPSKETVPRGRPGDGVGVRMLCWQAISFGRIHGPGDYPQVRPALFHYHLGSRLAYVIGQDSILARCPGFNNRAISFTGGRARRRRIGGRYGRRRRSSARVRYDKRVF